MLMANHFHGAVLAVAGGIFAYIVMFGMDEHRHRGVREFILVRFQRHPLGAELLATVVYAVILIVLIATPYRLVVFPLSPLYADIGWPAMASLLTIFGLSGYILLTYPESLDTDSKYGFLRGFIASIFTVLSVCTALYA